jgi:hypothetical protein
MHTSVRETVETEVNTRLEDFGDLIVQNVGVGLLIPAEDLGGGETLPFDQRVANYDVMGDVNRYGADEAVLLCQKLRGLQILLAGSDEDPTNLEFRYVFGFDSDQVVRDRQDDNRPTDNSVVLAANEVNNDVLYHLSGNVQGQVEDANGSSSAVNYITSDSTNYLHEVGVLPEVSARENLNETLQLSTTTGGEQIESQSIKFFTNWQLYWLETDEEVEGRRIDLLE